MQFINLSKYLILKEFEKFFDTLECKFTISKILLYRDYIERF